MAIEGPARSNIYSSNGYLLSTYCVPGTGLDPGVQ